MRVSQARRLAVCVVTALSLVHCGGDDSVSGDTGPGDAGRDASQQDLGPREDGSTPADTGPTPDAGPLLDASRDDGGTPDAGPAPDAGPVEDSGANDARPADAGGLCASWSLRTIAEPSWVEILDPEEISPARTFRLLVEHPLACHEQIAAYHLTADSRTRRLDIRIRVWEQNGIACAGPTTTEVRIVPVRLPSPGTWEVYFDPDAASARFSLDVLDPLPRPCATPGAGEPCAMDCDCPEGQQCLGRLEGGFQRNECASSCERSFDCRSGLCLVSDLGLSHVCSTDFAGCDATSPCPAGYRCEASECVADFRLAGATRHECACDADCDPPLGCVEPERPGAPRRCELRCPTGSARWCSFMHWCFEAEMDVSGLAESDAVCGWVGE